MEKHELIQSVSTTDEWLLELGEHLRTLRLRQNVDQKTLAARAGISVSALHALEHGRGASLSSFVKTLRALGKADWLTTLAPVVSISPLQMLKSKHSRERASSRTTKKSVIP
jgi:transcriptional regulator with XRE-family HTH domain